jgi:hypothetical protein
VPPGTITVSNNLWQATAILSGQLYAKIKGRSAVITNAPPGEYVVEFADVQYYQRPPAQTNILNSGGTLSFQGNYTFTDVNSNGIPDAWELHFFGTLLTNRTQLTDTDGDGMSDYAEFIAGTDPNNPPPVFKVTARQMPSGIVRMQWPSVPGELFQVLQSTNFSNWTPYGNWISATGQLTTQDVPLSGPGAYTFFRVQTAALKMTSDLPPNLKPWILRLPNGSLELQWNSAIGRGYQVQGSADARTWAPVSDWMRATTPITSFVLPAPAPGAPFLFRIEVQP